MIHIIIFFASAGYKGEAIGFDFASSNKRLQQTKSNEKFTKRPANLLYMQGV